MLDTPVTIHKDGCAYVVPPGKRVEVKVGESITLHCGVCHSFWAEGGDFLIYPLFSEYPNMPAKEQ